MKSNQIPSFILKNSLFIIIFLLLITLFAASFLPKIKMDTSVDVFFKKSGENYKSLQKWKDQFGSDDIIFIVFSDDNLFSTRTLTMIDTLTQEIETLTHVNNAESLTNVNDILGYEEDFIVEKLIEEIPKEGDKDGLETLKQRAISNPLYTRNLISPDGKTTAILVELENEAVDNTTYKKQTIEDIKSLLNQNFPRGKTYHLGGSVVTGYYFALYMIRDLKTFIPIMLMIIAILLMICFRNIKIAALPLITIGVTLSLTMAVLYFLGYSINNITTIIPPILMAIAIADSIHLVSETIQAKKEENDPKDKTAYIKETIGHLFFPCFLTTVTTAVGFFSLAVSNVLPVRTLGIVVGIGVFIALGVTFVLLPALIKTFNVFEQVSQKKEKGKWLRLFDSKSDSLFLKIGQFNEKHKVSVLITTGILICVCVIGITKIRVETSVLEFFSKKSPLYQSTTYIEDHLSGVHTLNISLKSAQNDLFKEPETLRAIEEITQYLYSYPEIDKVTSINDYLKEINKSFHNEDENFYVIPDSRQLVAQYVLLYGADDLDDYVNLGWNWSTIRIRIKEHSSLKLAKIIEDIQAHLQQYADQFEVMDIVGETVLEVESNSEVTDGQLKSLGLAMIVIFGMMFIVFRSIRLGLISIIPNVLPILINFGIMGWFGIRLDSATSMIAAVGIGIVVDDTIHYLHCFESELKKTGNYTKAMYNSLAIKGRPIVLTSVILFFGFGIIGFSQFVPTSYFGSLSALLMINALIADLIVLPCTLLLLRK